MLKKGGKNMTIEERLENMEQEMGRVKRRNRWLLGAILLLLGGFVFAGLSKTTVKPAQAQITGTPEEIRTKRILIEDENGNVRARLLAIKEGPSLSLWDENGKPRASLHLIKDGPSLMLLNENGKPGASLNLYKDNRFLTLYDENGKPRVSLSAYKIGSDLMLYDENSMLRARLNALKDGPQLMLLDNNFQMRFSAGKAQTLSPDGKAIVERPESSLVLCGPDGKVIWSAIE